ncbi:hypothetical protein BXZ70DRAFT_217400 [Cristinia sonorae]|uniref:Uncharacterized protein n=1 Tax=Cristinia sonorae TaxID=1940300 RepID=A0A8K0XP16_9AGAR|nr:hypothetical protein BXZ70DRAFT_217400 [Cristinia sonorae]
MVDVDETVEEQLLGALLSANEQLTEALKMFEDLERVKKEKDVEERSKKETRANYRVRARHHNNDSDGSIPQSMRVKSTRRKADSLSLQGRDLETMINRKCQFGGGTEGVDHIPCQRFFTLIIVGSTLHHLRLTRHHQTCISTVLMVVRVRVRVAKTFRGRHEKHNHMVISMG